jgi:hypothetical protein
MSHEHLPNVLRTSSKRPTNILQMSHDCMCYTSDIKHLPNIIQLLNIRLTNNLHMCMNCVTNFLQSILQHVSSAAFTLVNFTAKLPATLAVTEAIHALFKVDKARDPLCHILQDCHQC